MVSLNKFTSGGYEYYRIVKSVRVDGKPRAIPVEYLGNAEAILEKVRSCPAGTQVNSYAHGHVAALKHAADRLNLAAVIDDVVGYPDREISIGTSLELVALNRAVEPTSKRGFQEWADGTSLDYLYPSVDLSKCTSQHFWRQMDPLESDDLEAIEEEVTRRLMEMYDLDLDLLFYDTTNFYTYIHTTNDATELAQRGRNKQHRNDLRQVNVALLVHRGTGFPLASHVYEGNRVDTDSFPETLTKIRERLEDLAASVEQITLVYDKGNNSKANQARVDDDKLGYVASLSATQHRSLTPALPEETDAPEVETLEEPFEDEQAVRFRDELWDAERTFVLYRSERLQEGQIRGLRRDLTTALEELNEWKEKLARPGTGPRSQENADKQIDDLLSRQYLDTVLSVSYDFDAAGADRLEWTLDSDELERLETEQFGLRLLMTDQHEWETEEIMSAYHSQGHIERTFRHLKDVDHFAIRPQFHWTDQKIRVHVFTCLMAYLLTKMLDLEAREHGWHGSLSGLLEWLERVRLAQLLTPSAEVEEGGDPDVEHLLEESPPEAIALFEQLVPDRAPFVYTTQIE